MYNVLLKFKLIQNTVCQMQRRRLLTNKLTKWENIYILYECHNSYECVDWTECEIEGIFQHDHNLINVAVYNVYSKIL